VTDEPSNRVPPMKHTNINVPSWQMTALIEATADMQRHIHAVENHVWYLTLYAKASTVAVVLLAVMVAVAVLV